MLWANNVHCLQLLSPALNLGPASQPVLPELLPIRRTTVITGCNWWVPPPTLPFYMESPHAATGSKYSNNRKNAGCSTSLQPEKPTSAATAAGGASPQHGGGRWRLSTILHPSLLGGSLKSGRVRGKFLVPGGAGGGRGLWPEWREASSGQPAPWGWERLAKASPRTEGHCRRPWRRVAQTPCWALGRWAQEVAPGTGTNALPGERSLGTSSTPELAHLPEARSQGELKLQAREVGMEALSPDGASFSFWKEAALQAWEPHPEVSPETTPAPEWLAAGGQWSGQGQAAPTSQGEPQIPGSGQEARQLSEQPPT